MKIIHTSDWHLGQEFYTYDRTQEHEAFLDQLAMIVRKEKPDALVISGDIYHTSAPSNSVMRFFTERLDMIRQACPGMNVILTAGNHDSSSRLEITRSLWAHLGVTVVGRIERKADGSVDLDRHIVSVYDNAGHKCGYVVAMPHVFPQNYPYMEDGQGENRQRAFMARLGKHVSEINTEELPVVMTAHMALTGSDMSGHDASRGGMDCTDIGDIPVPYDYLALGHIHFPQTIRGGKARYCGSPVPVSFDENYPHSISVVTVVKDSLPDIKTVRVVNPLPVKTIPEHAASFDEVLGLLGNFPSDENAYIRANVILEDVPPANAFLKASEALAGKKARFCTFKWEKAGNAPQTSSVRLDVEQIRSISPVNLAMMYYRDRFGTEMTDGMKGLLEEAIRNVSNQ